MMTSPRLHATLVLTLLIVPFADAAPQGIEAEGHGRLVEVRPGKIDEPRFTFSERFAMPGDGVPAITFGKLDLGPILEEDERILQEGGRLRAAYPREPSLLTSDGSWARVPGGWLWRLDFVCEWALGVNVHVAQMELPEGAAIIVYDPDRPGEFDGPFTGTGEFGTGDAWIVTFDTDDVRIEYFEPDRPGTRRSRHLPFDIPVVHHLYRPPFLDGGDDRGAGSCHNDPACYDDWYDVSMATARILVSNSSYCSGQLIATIMGDESPYFYTANHCIENASEANSTVFLFRYMRLTCGGGVNSGTSIFGGSELVSAAPCGGDGNTLVMINRELPSTVFWVGWTTAGISNGTDTTGLHHPAGDYMRISFGDKIAGDSCLYGQDWSSGTTEGGSSGSGIYRNSDQKIFGSLCCTQSLDGCDAQWALNYYNRFNVSGFNAHLVSGPDDDFEDNDDCASAVDIDNGTHSDLVIKSTDEDWYHVSVVNGGNLDVTATFSDINGDIDIRLYAADCDTVLAFSQTNSNNESFSWTNTTGADGDFYLRVYLDTGQRNDYALNIAADQTAVGACCVGETCSVMSEGGCNTAGGTYEGDGTTCEVEICIPGPANDDCAAPDTVTDGANTIDTNYASTDGPDESGCTIVKDVWYRWTASCTGGGLMAISGSTPINFEPVMAVYLACPTGPGELIACGSPATGNIATFDATSGQEYLVRVGSADGIEGDGMLIIACQPSDDCPTDIDGNGATDVNDLLAVIAAWGSSGGDEDINGDGVVDVTDLLEVISAWGPC